MLDVLQPSVDVGGCSDGTSAASFASCQDSAEGHMAFGNFDASQGEISCGVVDAFDDGNVRRDSRPCSDAMDHNRQVNFTDAPSGSADPDSVQDVSKVEHIASNHVEARDHELSATVEMVGASQFSDSTSPPPGLALPPGLDVDPSHVGISNELLSMEEFNDDGCGDTPWQNSALDPIDTSVKKSPGSFVELLGDLQPAPQASIPQTLTRALQQQYLEVGCGRLVGDCVSCAYKSCPWRGTVEDYNAHLSTCSRRPTLCPTQGCGWRGTCSLLPAHLETCGFVRVDARRPAGPAPRPAARTRLSGGRALRSRAPPKVEPDHPGRLREVPRRRRPAPEPKTQVEAAGVRVPVQCGPGFRLVKVPFRDRDVAGGLSEAQRLEDSALQAAIAASKLESGVKVFTDHKVDAWHSDIDDVCAICLDSICQGVLGVAVLGCGHRFHWQCLPAMQMPPPKPPKPGESSQIHRVTFACAVCRKPFDEALDGTSRADQHCNDSSSSSSAYAAATNFACGDTPLAAEVRFDLTDVSQAAASTTDAVSDCAAAISSLEDSTTQAKLMPDASTPVRPASESERSGRVASVLGNSDRVDLGNVCSGGSRRPLGDWRIRRRDPRSELIRSIFQLCDADANGWLRRSELMTFAVLTGFAGTSADWDAEYDAVCKDRPCDPEMGLDRRRFVEFVNEDSDEGCFCDDEELKRILKILQQDRRF